MKRTMKKTDMRKVSRFKNALRFIDDLIVLKVGGKFERSVSWEFILQKENGINAEGSFLDLGIKIKDNRFSISRYSKQDDFPFSIVRMPY